jgi:hypothetical protein
MNRSQAIHFVETLFDEGTLEEATHHYALTVVDLISVAENQELSRCHTPDELETWIRKDAFAWQARLSDEAFAEQFEIGQGRAYGCIEQMLSCVDHAFVFDLLGSITGSP